jgi:hypothetical protein
MLIMDEKRLELLLHRYFDQLLEPAERNELESMLLTSAAAREQFWNMARCNALIRFWGESECGRREAENHSFQIPPAACEAGRPRAFAPRRAWHWWIPISAAALFVFVAFMGYRDAVVRTPPAPSPASKLESKGVATVTRISRAKWAEGLEEIQLGQVLNRGWLRLEEGAVQIEFSRGARVVLEGPAELQLVSKNEAFLRSGKLNAIVPPPARGFKVVTPEFSVVDHGTEFGCIVGTNGQAEVHVFSGAVSWKPSANGVSGWELKGSQALRISDQRIQSIPAKRSLFLSEKELTRLDASRQLDRLDAWKNSSRWLREHPDGLVYLDFENENSRTHILHNRARNAQTNSEVSVIGCNLVDGRWRGKTGGEFSGVDDRLRLTAPGKFDALTYLAWVRVDALPPIQASLAMTESFTKGEVHWYIRHDGSLGLGVHNNDLPNYEHGWRLFNTQPGVISKNLGLWIMVATVFDRNSGSVTHYLNGRPIASGMIMARMPLHLDTFEIGNWGVRAADPRLAAQDRDEHGDVPRNLDGRLDEFAILATALQPEDIQRLYLEGRPGETILAKVTSRSDTLLQNQ